jgi:hypothetical protein
MTSWEMPSFIEVDMSAEIGGYQGDDDQRPGDMPDFVQTAQPIQGDASAERAALK